MGVNLATVTNIDRLIDMEKGPCLEKHLWIEGFNLEDDRLPCTL